MMGFRLAGLAGCIAVAALISACSSSSSPVPPGGAQLQAPVFFDAGAAGHTAASRVRVTHAVPPPPGVLTADPTARTRPTAAAEAAARWHLAQHADSLALDATTLASAEITLVHDTGRGAIVVKLGQRVGGIPVIRTSLAIVMDRSLALVAITGELAPVSTPVAPRFTLSAADAITRAIADAGAPPRALTRGADKAGYQRFDAAGLLIPARARQVLFPVGGQLVAAYQAELAFGGRSEPIQGYRHVFAADDGRLLYRTGLTRDAVFRYRVWADATGLKRPKDGPVAEYTPHPTGAPDGFMPAFVAPTLVAVDGLNSAPGGGFDPWLPAGATETTGNNVDAYADLGGGDGFGGGDIRADITSAGRFNRVYNTAAEPDASSDQIKASVTQLFYMTNWLHDFWYDSGFNEANANAQQDNLGRGGLGGDRLHVEAQDAGGTNNANMFTPADGESPRMQMYLWDAAGGARPDGTIDNDIVSHEFGHYLHLRQVECGSQSCYAMSEGWGDFTALMMTLRPGDDLHGVYGLGAYALQAFTANSAYFGIRRYPYSLDVSKSPLTFGHMQQGIPLPAGPEFTDVGFLQGSDNWEVHNAGEIWCSMLFTGLADLLADSQGPSPRFTFEQGRRRMADYIVAGMAATPVEPDFTAQRDAILAAALAADTEDFAVLAQAYAKRGFGTGAVSMGVNSPDGSGVVEDFAVRGRPDLVSAILVEDPAACDADGVLDAGETGTLTVQIRNIGAAGLTAPTVTVGSALPGVTFPAGATATFADIPLFGTATTTVQIRLGEVQPVPTRLTLSLSLREPSSPTPPVIATTQTDINLDITPLTASTDDVESPFPVWSSSGEWARRRLPTTAVFSVAPPLGSTDALLTSPALAVGTAAFSIEFSSRYRFGSGDGGVLEVSTDGTTWADAATLATTGYTGTVPAGGGNPLAGRDAWTGNSPGYPAFSTTTIDFGTTLANETVRLRFRMGGDNLSDGGAAWQLDNLALTGAGTPFATTVEDDLSCLPGLRPIAVAGPDAIVPVATAVALDGSGSSDPDGTIASYSWTQVGGTIVNLTDAASSTAHFVAPSFTTPQVLTFRLVVGDNDARVSIPDTIAITVQPLVSTPDAAVPVPDASPAPDAGGDVPDAGSPPDAGDPGIEGGGGCCQTGSRGAPGGIVLALAVMLGRRRRRRGIVRA